MAAASLIPFDNTPSGSNAQQVAEDNSLLQIDLELDVLLEQIEDEIEGAGRGLEGVDGPASGLRGSDER